MEIVVSTDIDKPTAEREMEALRERFVHLEFVLVCNPRSKHSRVDNLLGGIRASTAEYVWLIDDDDYIDLLAFENFQRRLTASELPIAFCASQVHHENWKAGNSGLAVLESTTPGIMWPSDGWTRLLKGVNHVPVCGAIMPRHFLQDSIRTFEFRYDLSEDYTLFLLLLSSPHLPEIIEIPEVIVHISVRGEGQNSISAIDRTNWTRDIAGFLFDLTHGDSTGQRGIWSILEAVQSHGNGAETRQDCLGLKRQNEALRRQIGALLGENAHLRNIISGSHE